MEATRLILSTIVILSSLSIPEVFGASSIIEPISNYLYTDTPTEVFPMKPLMIFPRSRDLKYFKSEEDQQRLDDDKVIYVQLLKMNYRPKNLAPLDEFDINSSHPNPKNIFYVKALTNGQFSDHRLKLYRIPEFYAINVYKKTN